MTTVRLATWGGLNDNSTFVPPPMTTVRLAGELHRDKTAIPLVTDRVPESQLPAILVSYFYWTEFKGQRKHYQFRDYLLDSGAYSAYKVGAKIELDAFADFALEALATDPQCAEVIALDVMRDWRAGQRNTEYLWARGVPAIPVYHYGEPVSLLMEYAAASPKICIGTAQFFQDNTNKMRFAEAVFSRVWPKKIHGLQFLTEPVMMAFPFHSVDSSSWQRGPAGFGSYKSMAKPYRAPRAEKIKLRAELEWYLALERKVRQRWRREMALLEQVCPLEKTRASAVG